VIGNLNNMHPYRKAAKVHDENEEQKTLVSLKREQEIEEQRYKLVFALWMLLFMINIALAGIECHEQKKQQPTNRR
jgi:hypothetical protein